MTQLDSGGFEVLSPVDEINEHLGYDADIADPSQYCRHGTFIGSWWGPDHMCGMCEDGSDYCENEGCNRIVYRGDYEEAKRDFRRMGVYLRRPRHARGYCVSCLMRENGWAGPELSHEAWEAMLVDRLAAMPAGDHPSIIQLMRDELWRRGSYRWFHARSLVESLEIAFGVSP